MTTETKEPTLDDLFSLGLKVYRPEGIKFSHWLKCPYCKKSKGFDGKKVLGWCYKLNDPRVCCVFECQYCFGRFRFKLGEPSCFVGAIINATSLCLDRSKEMKELTLDDLYRIEKAGINRDVADKELFGLIALAREALEARQNKQEVLCNHEWTKITDNSICHGMSICLKCHSTRDEPPTLNDLWGHDIGGEPK